MKRLFVLLPVLLWSACPIEHADNDSGAGSDSGVTADAAVDGSSGDAVRPDAAGTDQSAFDAVQPDTASTDATGHDSATSSDAAHPDTAMATDHAVTDTHVADSQVADSQMADSAPQVDAKVSDATEPPDAAGTDATFVCSNDDSYEENDDPGSARPITVPGTVSNLVGCDDDWFSFSVPAGHGVRVTIGFMHSQADLDLTIYDGNATHTYDSSTSTSNAEVVTAGPFAAITPVLVEVLRFSTAGHRTGYTMTVEFEEAPANDLCSAAQIVTLAADGTAVVVSGDTSLAGDEGLSTIDCQWGSGGRDVYYTFTTGPSMTGYVFATLQATWAGVVYAFAGSCDASADLVCSHDPTYFAVTPSTTYYVAVDANNTGAGLFTLTLSYVPAPANTTCAGAKVIAPPTSGTPLVERGLTGGDVDSRDAVSDSPYCQAVARHAPELFYRIDTGASGAGTLHLSLDAPGWDAALYMFTASCDATADLSCVGEYYFTDPIWYRQPVEANQSYFIVVDGYGDIAETVSLNRGPFELSVRYYVSAPALQGGETCQSAVALEGARGSAHGSTIEGVHDLSPGDIGCSDNAYGYDKFYTLTLQPGQTATVQLEHGDHLKQAVLAVAQFIGCELRANSCLDSYAFDDPESGTLTWTHSGNSAGVYYVIVDAQYTYHGEEYDLFWEVTGP